MKLGFVGTGTIAASIVRALGTDFGKESTIHVSPRSADVAAGLARQFPHVTVAGSNQAVLDASDMVVLAVRPQIATEVISKLRFRPDHHVISLVATYSLETLTELVAPAGKLTKAVPIPPIAFGRGPTPIYPPDPVVAALFDKVGFAIPVDTPELFDALTSVTATMAPYFALAAAISDWLAGHGLPEAQARRYVAGVFDGLAQTAIRAGEKSFEELAVEHATAGGLNEQLRRRLTEQGVYGHVADGLDEILARVQGK